MKIFDKIKSIYRHQFGHIYKTLKKFNVCPYIEEFVASGLLYSCNYDYIIKINDAGYCIYTLKYTSWSINSIKNFIKNDAYFINIRKPYKGVCNYINITHHIDEYFSPTGKKAYYIFFKKEKYDFVIKQVMLNKFDFYKFVKFVYTQ